MIFYSKFITQSSDIYLVNDVGELKLRTFVIADVSWRLEPAALEIPLLKLRKKVRNQLEVA